MDKSNDDTQKRLDHLESDLDQLERTVPGADIERVAGYAAALRSSIEQGERDMEEDMKSEVDQISDDADTLDRISNQMNTT